MLRIHWNWTISGNSEHYGINHLHALVVLVKHRGISRFPARNVSESQHWCPGMNYNQSGLGI